VLKKLEFAFEKFWHRYILLWWYRLLIRMDEFHPSLSLDTVAMEDMNEVEKKKYLDDLAIRKIAHEREFARKIADYEKEEYEKLYGKFLDP